MALSQNKVYRVVFSPTEFTYCVKSNTDYAGYENFHSMKRVNLFYPNATEIEVISESDFNILLKS